MKAEKNVKEKVKPFNKCSFSVLTGAIAGVFILGLGGRIAMTIIAFTCVLI
jgi:hypothetical protein